MEVITLLRISIAFAVQAAFVWVAAKVVSLECRFKDAAINRRPRCHPLLDTRRAGD